VRERTDDGSRQLDLDELYELGGVRYGIDERGAYTGLLRL
jgi:hypothetical protein